MDHPSVRIFSSVPTTSIPAASNISRPATTMSSHLLLELGTESRGPRGIPGENRKATAPLEAIAADEPRLTVLQVAEPGDVEPAGAAVVEGGRLADQVFHEPRDPGAHHVFAEVVTHVSARVADAVGMLGRAGQQQQPRRLERRRGDNYDLRSEERRVG